MWKGQKSEVGMISAAGGCAVGHPQTHKKYWFEQLRNREGKKKVRLEWSLQLAGVQLGTHKPTRVDVVTWTFGQTELETEINWIAENIDFQSWYRVQY